MADPERRRKSKPAKAIVEKDPRTVARLEAENGLRQFDFVIEKLDEVLASDDQFVLKPSFVQALNRIAVQGLNELPGVYRPGGMTITNSKHEPPPAEEVPQMVEDMCDYINASRNESPWHLAAYSMWRLNWIHPFEDGNGRTSRALSYFVLCWKLDQKLPGRKAIPDFIAASKEPYYTALDLADRADKDEKIDVGELEEILKQALAAQLAEFHHDITGVKIDPALQLNAPEAKLDIVPGRRDSFLHRMYEKNPFWFWLGGILIASLVAWAMAM